MEGKPLYEYARESKPLPRAIPVRQCQVTIDLIDFKPASVTPGDGGHEWSWPKEHLSDEEKGVFKRLTEMVEAVGTEVKNRGPGVTVSPKDANADPSSKVKAEAAEGEAAYVDTTAGHAHAESAALLDGPHPEISPVTGLRPAAFKVRMTVSSGTYVRSIVHDIGLALGCGAHVVTLTRTRQGQFVLYGDEVELERKKQETMERWYAAHPNVGATETEASGSGSGPGPVAAEVDVKMEGTDEEAALNASAGPSSSAAPAVAAATASAPTSSGAQLEDEEEAMLNALSAPPRPASASASTAGPSTAAHALPEPPQYTQTKARLPGQTVDYSSSTTSIPWSVFSRALEDREKMLADEKAQQAAAEANKGDDRMSPAEMKAYFSKEKVMERRRARPLQEWEEYVLARFEEVPVPIGGLHGNARYR